MRILQRILINTQCAMPLFLRALLSQPSAAQHHLFICRSFAWLFASANITFSAQIHKLYSGKMHAHSNFIMHYGKLGIPPATIFNCDDASVNEPTQWQWQKPSFGMNNNNYSGRSFIRRYSLRQPRVWFFFSVSWSQCLAWFACTYSVHTYYGQYRHIVRRYGVWYPSMISYMSTKNRGQRQSLDYNV